MITTKRFVWPTVDLSGFTMGEEEKKYLRVALIGGMHSGKSTVSKVLVEELGYTRMAFADPVKDMSVIATNAILYEAARITGYDINWTLKTRQDIDEDKQMYRLLHQHIGAYLRGERGENFWIEVFDLNLYGEDTVPEKIVVDDVRYLNEAKYVRGQEFTVVKINRPKVDRKESIAQSYLATHGRPIKKSQLKQILSHESEDEIDQIEPDLILDNLGTIGDLWTAARKVFS